MPEFDKLKPLSLSEAKDRFAKDEQGRIYKIVIHFTPDGKSTTTWEPFMEPDGSHCLSPSPRYAQFIEDECDGDPRIAASTGRKFWGGVNPEERRR